MRVAVVAALVCAGCAGRIAVPQPVEVHAGQGFSMYGSGRVRVYLSQEFVRQLQSQPEPGEIQLADVAILFERGVLTGDMFATSVFTKLKRQRHYTPRTADSVWDALERDPGSLMKVLNCEDVTQPEDGGRKKLDLWVTFNPYESGWGSFFHYTATLAVPTGGASLRESLQKATLVSLELRGEEI